MRQLFVIATLSALLPLSFAASPKLVRPAVAPLAAPTVAIIAGAPLTVHVGSDFTFQVYNSAVPGSGQIYPDDANQTGDMGWFVRAGSTKYAPDFSQHPGGTATESIGANTAWTVGTQSSVSGAGTAGNPYKVTTTNTLPTLSLTATQEVTYVNGENFFRKKMTLASSATSPLAASVFLGADIYLAGNDDGVPQYVGSSPGGKDCAAGTYNILIIPQGNVAPVAHSAKDYDVVWTEIGSGSLSNQVSAGCQDNGAALQWNVNVPASGTTVIEAATSFGAIPTSITSGAPVDVPLLAPLALLALIAGVGVVGASRRRKV